MPTHRGKFFHAETTNETGTVFGQDARSNTDKNAMSSEHAAMSTASDGNRSGAFAEDQGFLEVAINSIDEAIVVTTTNLQYPGPQIEYVNAAFTRMTGYEAHEVLGRTPRMLQGRATDRRLLDSMRTALTEGRSFRGEAVNYRKDGTEYLADWTITPARGAEGEIRHWISVQHDITARKQLESNLVSKEERLRTIVASALDYAIFVTDTRDTIVDWWPGAEAVYGWSAEQAVGRAASITFTREDRDAAIPEGEIAVAMRDGIAPNVRWHLHADGHKVFIEGSVRTLRDRNGSLVGFLKVGQDVTARKAAEQRLQESEARLARAVAAARLSTWEWSAENDTLHFSVGVEALLLRPQGSLSSVDAMLQAIHPKDRLATAVAIRRALLNGQNDLVTEFRALLPDGQTRWLQITGMAEPNNGERPTRMAGVMQDITERREAANHIARLACYDGLTGLANRGTLHAELANALSHATRGEAFAVLALDLDGFKEVNDVLGHATGDAVLCSVAARLRQSVREVDIVARPGGDEFVIIQYGLDRADDAKILASRLICALEQPHRIGAQMVNIRLSIGIALIPDDGTDLEQVLRAADLALYAAKTQNGSSWQFFEPRMQEQVAMRRQMEADLRTALGENQFELHYQPLIDLAANRILGFEALVRWHHPVRGLVPPGMFITLAEETGLIEALGSWVLAKACEDAVRWPSPLRVAVNLSVRQFSNDRLPDIVATALRTTGLAPGRLDLEITESLLLRDTDENLAILHQLRAQGVSISMDDFGTGYSSLSYIAGFPFNRMKIDRSFVARATEKQGAAIIRAVVDLCRSLDIAVTAEGIETEEQLRQLSSLGCTEGQGFLLAQPCPAADVAGLVRHWNGDGA